jgi:hypothetical protein
MRSNPAFEVQGWWSWRTYASKQRMHVDGWDVRAVAIHLLFSRLDLSGVSFVFALELMPTLAAIISAKPLLCSRWQGWLEVVAALGTAHGALLQF